MATTVLSTVRGDPFASGCQAKAKPRIARRGRMPAALQIPAAWFLALLPGIGAGVAFGQGEPVAVSSWGVGRPVPPYEATWEGPTVREPATLALWAFDEQARMTEEDLDAWFDDHGGPPLEAGAAAGIDRGATPAYRLEGDARLTPDGLFGGGVRMDEQGRVVSEPVRLGRLLQGEPFRFTIDFWIRPSAATVPGENAILTLTAGRGDGSRVWLSRNQEEQITVHLDNEVIFTHTRPAPGGRWTHLALTVSRDVYRGSFRPVMHDAGMVTLRVDGTAERASDAWRTAIFALIRDIDPGFWLGAGPDGVRGFTGDVDEVHLRAREPSFYERRAWVFPDSPGANEPVRGFPWFVSDRKPYLLATFDQGVRPERFHGLEAGGEDHPHARAPGVRGQALNLSAIAATDWSVGGFSALPKEQGSIEFWFRPKDWNNFYHGDYTGSDVTSFPLLRLESPRDEHPSYPGIRSVRILTGRNHQHVHARTPWVPFHPGKWTHAVLTWDGDRTAVYLDGRPQAQTQLTLSRLPKGGATASAMAYDAWEKRTGGKDDGTYRLRFQPSNTLVDELRVYDWPFRPEEAWNAFAGYLPPDGTKPLHELPTIETAFTYYAHCWERVERLAIDVTCLPVRGVPPATVEIELYDGGGQRIFAHPGQVLTPEGQARVAVTAALPFGVYPVRVSSRDAAGAELATSETAYVRERPVWYQNQLGKDRTVPPPWTPITVDGNTLRVIERVIALQPGGLPGAIVTRGVDLLAAPMTVHIRQGTAWHKLTAAGTPQFREQADDRVAWEAAMQSDTVRLAVDAWMEFDGLMVYTLTLAPKDGAPLTIDELRIDITFPDETVNQLIANTGAFQFRRAYDVRMIPNGEGSVWNSMDAKPSMARGVDIGNFLANLWLGGDDIGLNVSAENDQGWTPDDQRPAHEILRAPGRVVYRMNVITRPVTIEGEREFGFILLPTPAKPEPPGWRAWGRVPAGQSRSHAGLIDQFTGFKLTDTPTRQAPGVTFTLEPASWEDAAAQAARLRQTMAHQMLDEDPLFFYIDASWPTLGPSIKDWNHDLHLGTGRIAWIPEVEDYHVWIINEYLKRDLIQGLYIDDVSMGRTYSLDSTAYPFPESERGRRVGYNTMGFRRFLKRVYRLFIEHGKTPHILPHMTWCFELPAFSFVNATLNGEDRDLHPYTERTAMNVWSTEELRIMGNAPKWGFATWFKGNVVPDTNPPQVKLHENWKHRQFRAQFAMFVPHDIWQMFPEDRVIREVFNVFGMDHPELRFIPYWAIDGELAIEADWPANIIGGIFARPDRALVMVSNLADEDQEVKLTVNALRLFGRETPVTITDADISLAVPFWEERNARQQVEAAKLAATPDAGAQPGLEQPAGPDDVMALLEGGDFAQRQEHERLRLQSLRNTATVVVRHHDYRILAVNADDRHPVD